MRWPHTRPRHTRGTLDNNREAWRGHSRANFELLAPLSVVVDECIVSFGKQEVRMYWADLVVCAGFMEKDRLIALEQDLVNGVSYLGR
jgi:hypothetical protein